ncbi:MAG: nickel pincer cofactor biosynthesis protein LarC [Prochlorotrichaceae cyanobacterium]
MKIAYFDCPTGIAGDMCLGALIHAGVPLEYLEESLAKLGITEEYTLSLETVQRRGMAASKLQVNLKVSNPPVRHLATIETLIGNAHLPPVVEAWSLAIFRKLALAEAAVHGSTPEAVHFHEVGATDALVDIVGTCLGLHWLGIEAVYCSALPTGGGTVRAAHGRLPVPVPAVLQLWQMGQVPIYGNEIDRELVTPTGAAIVVTLAKQFGPCPPLCLHQVGLGAGNRELPLPNILRLWVGNTPEFRGNPVADSVHHHHHHADHHPDSSPHHHHHAHQTADSAPDPDDRFEQDQTHPHDHEALSPTPETIVQLQTQLDDLNPQILGYLFDRLLALGALDVFTTAIGMKKSRPGILLTVICHTAQVKACEALIFQETTTLGIRRSVQDRQILQRRLESVNTPYGAVRVKVAWQAEDPYPSSLLNVQPEYEDCATIARDQRIPLMQIHQAALSAWHSQPQTL